MHLIWYNSIERKYENGSTREYKSLKSNTNNLDAFTLLMEFAGENISLANKIKQELNVANMEEFQFAVR